MVALNGTPSPEASLALATSGWSHIRAVTAGGSSVRIADITVTPAKYGCAGDGTTDDTTKLNTMISDVRALVSGSRVRVKIDLNGGVYKVTGNGLDMTGIRAWNFEVCNGVILGHTTGKPVVDLVGSRGYVFRNVLVYGDETDMPTLPFLCARGTATADAYCDNNLFDNVTTIGFYSVAAFYAYAQETTKHLHCRYWNYNHDAYVAIFEGKDQHPQTSTNKTVITGAASFTNCQYDTVDFRYLPSGKTATITGITKANPAVVTCSGGHPFANGQVVIMWNISGMTEMNARKATISNVTATTFEMTGVNSTGWGSFTSGSAIRAATKPAIYMNRMEQHRFTSCYVAAYGDHAIEIEYVDSIPWQQNTLDFLIEGAQNVSPIRWTVGTNILAVRDCEIKCLNTHSLTSFFSTNAGVGGQVSFYGGEISVTRHTYNSLDLHDTASKYAFLAGTRIFWPARANVTPASYSQPFVADLRCVDDGLGHIWGYKYKDVSTGSFSPTVLATTGTITTLGTVTGYAFYLGDMVWVEYSITITTNGTGATSITATLPATAASGAVSVLNGRARDVSGQQLQGRIGSSGTLVTIFTDDNTYPGADGETLVLSGWYRRA